jgi:hypothetical protein
MADGSRSSLSEKPLQNHRPAWTFWLVPSVADLIFVAVLVSVVFTPLSVKLLADAGIGWHIRTGQHILATHAIPRVDPFSSQLHKPWIAWEWLYDVIVGRMEISAGLNGVVWFTTIVIAAVFAATFRLLIRRGTNILVALVLVLLAIAASMIHFLARPHVLSWLFALISFWILDSMDSYRDQVPRWRVWLLPLLMLIWVNVHGGFLLGFVLLAIFWLGSLWTSFRLKESRIEESLEKIAAGKRARQLAVVGVASLLASFANPYGWRLHEHIYSYLRDRFLMDHIDEFQSPNFHGVAQRCFLVLLLIVIAALATQRRKLRLTSILLVLFAVYAGLYASRNIPIAAILLVLIIGPMLPGIGLTRFAQRMRSVDSALRGHLWPIVAGLVTLLIAVNGGRVASGQWMDAHFDFNRMPVAAVTFLGTQGQGPVLSPDFWGGYVIYRLYPYAPVVVDDRHDFYGPEFLKSYLQIIHVGKGWNEFLQEQGAAYVLLPRHYALAGVLEKTSGWRSIYADDVAIIFARNPRGSEPQERRAK